MLLNTIALALEGLRRNLMRSFLTMLGVVIGVSAVVTMVTLGNGTNRSVAARAPSLGSNLIIVAPGQRGVGLGWQRGTAVKVGDAAAIATRSADRAVAPSASQSVAVVAMVKNWITSVTGAPSPYFTAANWNLAWDTCSPRRRNDRRGVRLGETVRQKLSATPIRGSATFASSSSRCESSACCARKARPPWRDNNDTVIVPLRTLQRRVTGSQDVSQMMVARQEARPPNASRRWSKI